MKNSHKSRAIVARLLVFGLFILIAIFYFDSCTPLKLKRHTMTRVDKIINQQTFYEEEIWCNNTNEGRHVFRLDHKITVAEYLSGSIKKEKKTDTLFVGIMPIDLPCSQKLSFSD